MKKIYYVRIGSKEVVRIPKTKRCVVWLDVYGNTKHRIVYEDEIIDDIIARIKSDYDFQSIKYVIDFNNINITSEYE